MSRSGSWSGAGGPWTPAAGWTIGFEALTAQLWRYAYSFPVPALIPQLAAAVATIAMVVAVIAWAVTATRPAHLHGDARMGGSVVRATTVAIVVAVATVCLCAVRAPMWIRLGEAMPQMLWLAHRSQPQSLSGASAPAWAGTYHFSNVYRSEAGYTEFDITVSGILQSASYIYSPGSDPESRDRRSGFSTAGGVHYRHLLGPWWAATSDVPGT